MIRDAGRRTRAAYTVTLPKREAHRAAVDIRSVDEFRKRKTIEGNSGGGESNRRRVGTVVHDDRGMASVEWHDAPADFERPVLEVLDGTGLTLKNDDESCDPYSRHGATLPRTRPGNTTRTDLRKLSEWIKMKRALEERRRRGEADDDDRDES